MNLRDLLVDLNEEFYAYKNDIFNEILQKYWVYLQSEHKVGFNPPPRFIVPDLL